MLLGFDKDGVLVNFRFNNLVNKTHKLSNGNNVTYKALVDYDARFPRFNAIGNNKTNSFKTASICFALAAEPNYNIGEFDEDTSLYITLAGKGTIDSKGVLRKVSGYAAGTLGCGCMAYGHISPTRTIGYYGATDQVDDVAAVYGTWSLKLKS